MTKGYKKTLSGDGYVHCLAFADSFFSVCVSVYLCMSKHQIVHVKYVRFITYQLCLNETMEGKKRRERNRGKEKLSTIL